MIKYLITITLFLVSLTTFAETKRIPQLSNDKVTVWETILYPNQDQKLKMHHHDHDRVLISFDSGTIQVTNDKGQSHLLILEKNKPYFLKKDIGQEKHIDVNITKNPMRIMVIELKY